ncbi:hypothetical protein [Bradyrhizobium ottawaense]|uniref:DUF4167 domain-containing protein n=1 Tax=Bradyrhizobium ottawaense TaxID=931866 RepID=A0ABY0QH48_9BRAD|nr:hypothetical protein [Bradyrhizobium ottawaense]SDK40656.1 hypothetical protein SAMN05444163_8038 [Bradyrhizobium ottawaense]
MNGAKGFRAREAAANYRYRDRRLVSNDVRAARAATLPGTSFHGEADEDDAVAVKAAEVVPAETEKVEIEPATAEQASGDTTETPVEAEPAKDETSENGDKAGKGKKNKNKDKG